MVKKIKKFFRKFRIERSAVLLLLFLCMALILSYRLFTLQIVNGEEYVNNFSLKTTRTRPIKSTRGNIYDVNGNVLASNELSYSVTLEDSGTYDSNKERALSLNGEIYQLIKLIEANGDTVTNDFHIVLDNADNFIFDVEGTSLSRFRADIYGHAKIEDLEEDEANSSADTIMEFLSDKFALFAYDNKEYTSEEKAEHGLPEELTKKEQLQILTIRYLLNNISYQKYLTITVAENVSEATIAAVMERQADLPGVDIEEGYIRVYTDSVYFAPILGYTGKISTEELEELSEEDPERYSTNSVVGKAGIEQYMETTLQGTDGEETIYVDNVGTVLEVDEEKSIAPSQGNDVYLSIDKDLQIAAYKVLEQRIAGIVATHIDTSLKELDEDTEYDGSSVPIPIYDVYYAFFNNNILDISHFSAADASAKEQEVYAKYQVKQQEVFDAVRAELTSSSPAAYNDLDEEMQGYLSYIVDELLIRKTGILSNTAMDTSDEVYQQYMREGSISLREFLTYAAGQNWIDISAISDGEDAYLTSDDIYQQLADYISNYLSTDTDFGKMLFKYMLLDDTITGEDVCYLLYDQGVLERDDRYNQLSAGLLDAATLIQTAIRELLITPAQLALQPCSGSMVITDPKTGAVRACVSYPGYDNNRLANQMDADYYNSLLSDLSEPLYNKATQEKTAPGSTFKMISATAGLMEGVIDDDTYFNCNGAFDKVSPTLHCWNLDGHGNLSIRGAIEESCNVYFSNIAYELGKSDPDDDTTYSETRALERLTQYAKLFDMDKKSGIEIAESSPEVTDESAIPSAIGQGTNNYTTSQLARYVTTLANSGTSYQISLLSRVTDSDGNVLEEYTPKTESTLDLPEYVWDDLHAGMRAVIRNMSYYSDLGVEVAGKTGTAQESGANHGLFVGYAPYDDPQIAVAVRISHGYSSTYAALAAKDVFNYYFDLKDESEIIVNKAVTDEVAAGQTD